MSALKIWTKDYSASALQQWKAGEYDDIYVDFVRDGTLGAGSARAGDARWPRLTELRAGSAKSLFHFDVQGSVAKSTHSGLPWLRYIRQQARSSVHFWPFDGWEISDKKSAIVEVYPRLWNQHPIRTGFTADQHDACSVADWLRSADDAADRLPGALSPSLDAHERERAEIEGWILGVDAQP